MGLSFPLKTVLVEDNAADRNNLVTILKTNPAFELLADFDNARDCVSYMQTHEADLLFLDIELQHESGLWLADEIKDMPAAIIFTTAHTHYAVKAFEACALDYLIKPLMPHDITEMLERLELKIKKETSFSNRKQISEVHNNYLAKDAIPTRIFINTVGKTDVVDLKNVMYFTSKEGYTHIQMATGERHISSKYIKIYAEAIEGHPDFVRVHRSTIVNKNYIKAVVKQKNLNKYNLQMANGDVLSVASLKKEDVIQLVVK